MKHCLIVDDSDVVRKVARTLLESLRYQVTEAATEQEARDACLKAMPDIIFLDWHMPGSNTIGFVTAIRQIKTGKQPYILFCITEHDEATLTRATAAGIDSTIFKPFDRGTLAAKFAEIEALAA